MKSLTKYIEQLQALLQTERFGRACRWYDAVDSTNTLALSWAKEGAAAGSLVAAEFQKRGRGRFRRTWTADAGQNLMFSLVLDSKAVRSRIEFLPLALAVAIADTLGQYVAPHRPLIKWPNDVMLAGRKVCGVLIESSTPSDGASQRAHIVAGIGVNVNQEVFPGDLVKTATSMFQILGRETDRIRLLSDMLLAIEKTLREVAVGRTDRLVTRYESLMFGLNRKVRFSRLDAKRQDEGTIMGVDAFGALRVKTAGGIEVVRAGEVTFQEGGRTRSNIRKLSDRSNPASSS